MRATDPPRQGEGWAGMAGTSKRPPYIRISAQRGMRSFVLFPRRARECHADRNVASLVRRPRAQTAVEHGHAKADDQFGHALFEPDMADADRSDLEHAGKLEALTGIL